MKCMMSSCIVIAWLNCLVGEFENALEFFWLELPFAFKFYVCMMVALIGCVPCNLNHLSVFAFKFVLFSLALCDVFRLDGMGLF
jgi:hypothetical protein